MQELNFPQYSFKVRTEAAKTQIFDAFRKKWVVLTPEEWVRQHLLVYLKETKSFPESLTAVETGINLNGLSRRCDVVYFDRKGKPLVLVECKAPEVKITQETFDQITKYNFVMGVEYLLISNGLNHLFAKVNFETNELQFLREIPEFGLLIS